MPEHDGPELVIGLVSPTGTDHLLLLRVLEDVLTQVGYRAVPVHLAGLMNNLQAQPWTALATIQREDERIRAYQHAGDDLCARLGFDDALTRLGLLAIRRVREDQGGDPLLPLPRTAYLMRSIKRLGELRTLRSIYGPKFLLVAAHTPTHLRQEALARRIADSRSERVNDSHRAAAAELLNIDEHEDSPVGQDVRNVFPQADVIVDASDPDRCKATLLRFVELLFGTRIHTPSADEQGMYFAHSASLQSSSSSRQVGASICTDRGRLVSTGCNEVARAGGGYYLEGDDPDGRDFRSAGDPSKQHKRYLVADLLDRLGASFADEEVGGKFQALKGQLISEFEQGEGALSESIAADVIEYQRAVHAEMSAVAEAARHGATVNGTSMYVTTFPCHECAKNLVATGIRRVVFLEPYVKSLVGDLYADSIAVEGAPATTWRVPFERLIGVAPRRFVDLFERVGRLKEPTTAAGRLTSQSRLIPAMEPNIPAIELELEDFFLSPFNEKMVSEGIAFTPTSGGGTHT